MKYVVTLLILVTLPTGLLLAQEEGGNGDPAQEFAKVHEEWKSMDAKLDKVIQAYRGADVDERKKLADEYQELVKQSASMLPVLREKALAAYQAAPNADKDVTGTLVGIVANDVRQDKYEAALSLASVLLENNCDEPAIHSFAGIAYYCIDDFDSARTQLLVAKEAKALTAVAQQCLNDLDAAEKLWAEEQDIRKIEASADDLPRVKLVTSKGEMVVELYENEAPQAVGNFVSLVEDGFYNGLTFHRVLPGFMAQGGCPDGTGAGGPGYDIYCECEREDYRKHFRGTLSMAHAGKNTGGSQFFLTFKRTHHLDGVHTVFGRVVEGMDVLAELQRRNPGQAGAPEPDKIVKAEVIRKRDHEYAPTKVK